MKTCNREVSNPQIGKQKCGLPQGHEYVCEYVPPKKETWDSPSEQFLDELEDDLIEQRALQAKANPSNGGFDHGITTGMDMILSQIINRIQAHFKDVEQRKAMTSVARDCGRSE